MRLNERKSGRTRAKSARPAKRYPLPQVAVLSKTSCLRKRGRTRASSIAAQATRPARKVTTVTCPLSLMRKTSLPGLRNMLSNPDAIVAPRHVFLVDTSAISAADHVKATLLRSCRAVYPSSTPHVTAADSGIDRQRLCICTSSRSVACILDTAVAADFICFVARVNNNTQHSTNVLPNPPPTPPPSFLFLLLLMFFQANEEMDACARSALAALRVQV
jgi:hypothetical protein